MGAQPPQARSSEFRRLAGTSAKEAKQSLTDGPLWGRERTLPRQRCKWTLGFGQAEGLEALA